MLVYMIRVVTLHCVGVMDYSSPRPLLFVEIDAKQYCRQGLKSLREKGKTNIHRKMI
jgi:hypothetical protein